ncbi:hypothetical protein BJ878DRAFT_264544 [Calycina marina]|uniref:Uncharacterized protein n=1 Tax=Calycina marina TaxID=1763456 RepID=A0A9P8CBP8_9HELO|nr:hypothetical protein BJ878DRAFT_264544 [Calycina marina]
MGRYNALPVHDEEVSSSGYMLPDPNPRFAPLPLFLDNDNNSNTKSSAGRRNPPKSASSDESPTTALNAILNSFDAATKEPKNGTVEGDGEDDEELVSSRVLTAAKPTTLAAHTQGHGPLFYSPTAASIPKPRARPRNYGLIGSEKGRINAGFNSTRVAPPEVTRTSSTHSIALRHPTPDLQTLQGAYVGNIEHLEEMAERLSMTSSSIDVAIKELHDEQKKIVSRKSSLLMSSPTADAVILGRQVSNAGSVLENIDLARGGGLSLEELVMSRTSSVSGTSRGRSASKSSRYAARPEPELEGRPLDSFVTTARPQIEPGWPRRPSGSTARSQPEELIAEQEEESSTLTKPVVDSLKIDTQSGKINNDEKPEEPKSPAASATTIEHARTAFADFDGVHSENPDYAEYLTNPIPGDESHLLRDHNGRQSLGRFSMMSGGEGELRNTQRTPSQDRLSTAGIEGAVARRSPSGDLTALGRLERRKTYADPDSGQQMVYYPAPVPMMLNLPQKLSKMPSSQARNQRRTHVLSTLPPAARGTAMWLSDVLETDKDRSVPEDDDVQHMEHVAQHQRATMEGKQLTSDVQHLPSQLRAATFFDLPGQEDVVEIKGQSAVATLDSILDASAHAPVNAFTDHAFAGRLGAEVYGKTRERRISSTTELMAADQKDKKRISSFNFFGKRSSSNELAKSDEQRRNEIAGVADRGEGHEDIEEADEESGSEGGEDEGSDEEREDMYYGAPTTLLAELQLRKQEQKNRTRPIQPVYPNGLHSTLLELDAVAQVEKKTRNKKRVNLAWEDPAGVPPEDEIDDEDVPLAFLFPNKRRVQEPHRPMGLMERREIEDNEPLSRRRDRLLGRPYQPPRASTMINASVPVLSEDDEETLGQRMRRLKGAASQSSLPKARPVSGAFSAELLSQFGGKETSASPGEEEETLGQRRKRLFAENAAREAEVGTSADSTAESPALNKRRSMADILQSHPAAGATQRLSSYSKPATGLLGMQDQANADRASTMMNLDREHRQGPKAFAAPAGGAPPPYAAQRNVSGPINIFGQQQQQQMFPQPSMSMKMYGQQPKQRMCAPTQGSYGFGNPMMAQQYANPYWLPYNSGMQMQTGYTIPPLRTMLCEDNHPLNKGQADMVERWRQSVMH